LNLIEVIAFLRQYQKQVKADRQTDREYIEADLADYETARKLAAEILPETLADLKRPLSDLLSIIDGFVEKQTRVCKVGKYEVSFSRRAIREESGLPNYRIKELFKELEELEYLEVEKSPRGLSYCYRLVAGRGVEKISCLLSPEQLKKKWVEVGGNGHFQWKGAVRADLRVGG
jgi:hypothetical protein